MVVRVTTWQIAVEYLASHAGRWVASAEIGEHVYQGACSRTAGHVLILRARRAGVPIESSEMGYRLGRNRELVCPTCGALRVKYEDEVICYGCVGTEYADLEVGRAPGEGDRSGKTWTDDEVRFVTENRHRMTNEQLGELLERSEASVRGLTRTRGLGKKQYVLTKPRGNNILDTPDRSF